MTFKNIESLLRVKLSKNAFVIALSLICTSGAWAQEPTDEAQEEHLEFAAIPALNYSSDAGFGFGAIGSIYGKEPELKPYRFATDVQVFLTTKGQHSHFLRVDWL